MGSDADNTGAPADDENEGLAVLSEATLAVDWNRPEEHAAWAHLQTAGDEVAFVDDDTETP